VSITAFKGQLLFCPECGKLYSDSIPFSAEMWGALCSCGGDLLYVFGQNRDETGQLCPLTSHATLYNCTQKEDA